MNKQGVIQQIIAMLSDKFRVTVRPDHPFLLNGPDLLVGGDGFLCACFIHVSKAGDHPTDLLVRLATSRLALPSHTFCVLVTDANTNFRTEKFIQQFDEVVLPDEASQLINTRPQKEARLVKDLRRVHEVVSKRASALLKMSAEFTSGRINPAPQRVLRNFRDKFFGHPAVVPSWIEPRASRKSTTVIESNGRIAAELHFGNGLAVRAALQPLLGYALRLDFEMDTGVPYPKFRGVNTLFVDKVPRLSHDPLKPLRCATFGGWLMMTVTSLSDYEVAVERTEKMLAPL